MKRVAIFVDAGYLYAQSAACLGSSKAKRENLKLNHSPLIEVLKNIATKVQPSAALLRIYWYDGTSRGPTQDHRTLADFDDVKLRLGFINSYGQQKGVDSLLVTDLVELARNGAICDALLLGGDEDLRIGVQIAQSFGVRVHLIGIEPSRGSQSLQLRNEVDTKHEISRTEVSKVLQVIISAAADVPVVLPNVGESTQSLATSTPDDLEHSMDKGIDSVLATLSQAEINEFAISIQSNASVPKVLDGRVLASCRTELQRDLTVVERSAMRKRFLKKLKLKKIIA